MNLVDSRKIAIFGYPGTGKSTFALELSKILKIKVFELDRIRWTERGKKASEADFLKKYEKMFDNKSWIIEETRSVVSTVGFKRLIQ